MEWFLSLSGRDSDVLIHEATMEDELEEEACVKAHRYVQVHGYGHCYEQVCWTDTGVFRNILVLTQVCTSMIVRYGATDTCVCCL